MNERGPNLPVTRVAVTCVPGIETNANAWPKRFAVYAWERFRNVFVTEAAIQLVSAVRFYLCAVFPFLEWGRRRAIAAVLRQTGGGDVPRAIVGHSKGTDWSVDTLYANPDIEVEALVLIGSVLSERYHGSKLERLVDRGQVKRILNVWSPNDDVIKLLSWWPAGGKAGSRGFADLRGDEPVWQYKTEEAHSTYFWSEFRDKHFGVIMEFILGAKGNRSRSDVQGPMSEVRGQSLVEYCAVLAFIVIAAAAVLVWIREWREARVDLAVRSAEEVRQ